MRQRDTTGVSLAPNDGFLLKLELHSDPQLLYVVRGALERLTEVFGFSPPDRRSVTRAVDEALTNIMRHCYNGRTDQPIQLYCKRVQIKPGGLGLHFIRQSMDTVEYQRVGTINQFRLVKYLQPATQSRTP